MISETRKLAMPGFWNQSALLVAAWSGARLLLPLSVLLLFFDFGTRGAHVLASDDEARFPMLARDILAHGTWLLPRLNGAPHLFKPPLFAWLIALVSWPLGQVTQATAAFTNLLTALGVVVSTYWIARRLFNETATAFAAGLVVVTTVGMFDYARTVKPDMTLCLGLTVAMATFVAAEFAGHPHAYVAAFALIGVASLTKGPVALLGVVVMITYTLVVDGLRGLRRQTLPTGLIVLGLLAVPWWFVAAAADRQHFTNDVVVTDLLLWYLPQRGWNWKAVTDPIVQAGELLLPWGLLLPWALRFPWRAAEPELGRRARFPLVWASVIFVFIALSHQQRMRYYLPLCPPIALVIAAWYSRLALRHKHAIGATVWLIVALGLTLRQGHVEARHNAATDLDAMVSLPATQARPIYVVGLPELPVTFYATQPVVMLKDYGQYETLVLQGREGWLAIADSHLPVWSTALRLQRFGGGRVNGHAFSVLAPGVMSSTPNITGWQPPSPQIVSERCVGTVRITGRPETFSDMPAGLAEGAPVTTPGPSYILAKLAESSRSPRPALTDRDARSEGRHHNRR